TSPESEHAPAAAAAGGRACPGSTLPYPRRAQPAPHPSRPPSRIRRRLPRARRRVPPPRRRRGRPLRGAHLPAPQLWVRHRPARARRPGGPRGRGGVPLRAGHALRRAPRRRGGRRARARRHRLPQPRAGRLLRGQHRRLLPRAGARITRVVVGLRHPLKHLRGKAIQSLRSEGIQVDVVGEDLQSKLFKEALTSCLIVNAPLLYRAAFRVPFSVLKYAMTADGKIAASSGHASWVSGRASRGRVFELRGRSDAVIVGGNTVRRDDPRLTARHVKGHVPVRIVMSQTCNLPEEANLWNVHEAYTIVATQRGARRDFQKKLAMKGVEVVEFDMLNPRDVMSYCYDRGYLSVLWECGGTLSAAAISARVIHKIDRDMLMSGFIQPIPDLSPVIPSADEIPSVDPEVSPYETNIISFYKTWDTFGAFSNFSPHPIDMPDEKGDCLTWPTVEHYYQAHKFVGVDNPQANDIVQEIKQARSPEEAARIGRTRQREFPELVYLNILL
uniref:5-amino-6-(5-phosphoribosylamino)uracil reductase n=1 Tax=Aegilops tauschii subsp. strangulata TaxID=200361 RepID=A0A453Q3B9_AEGTS